MLFCDDDEQSIFFFGILKIAMIFQSFYFILFEGMIFQSFKILTQSYRYINIFSSHKYKQIKSTTSGLQYLRMFCILNKRIFNKNTTLLLMFFWSGSLVASIAQLVGQCIIICRGRGSNPGRPLPPQLLLMF